MLWETVFGGVTGLLGNAVTAFINYKNTKVKNEHEIKMVELETAAMRAEAEMQIQVKKVEIEGAIELADAKSYTEGILVGNEKMFSEKWIDKLFSVSGWLRFFSIPFGVLIASAFAFIDFLRGFMRPALTMYLTGMTSVITWMAWDIIQKHGIETLSTKEALEIYNQVISIVIYLTVSTVTWWFADRKTSKFLQELNKNK